MWLVPACIYWSVQMEESLNEKEGAIMSDRTGIEAQMQVTMREIDPFDCWVSENSKASAPGLTPGIAGEQGGQPQQLIFAILQACTFHDLQPPHALKHASLSHLICHSRNVTTA